MHSQQHLDQPIAISCGSSTTPIGGRVLRIELTVYPDNERAVALYRKFGFEGTHRAYAMRNGRYVDTLTMARLHPDQPRVR